MSGDTAYFDVLDTEAKAYWLGFLTADGTLRPRGVELELHPRDRDHVYAFRDALGSTNKVLEKPARVRVQVCSVQLAQRLAELRFKQRVPALQSTLRRHYWRGLVDGDGSLSWERRRTSRLGGDWNVTLVGALPLLQGFVDFAAPYAGTPTIRQERSIWRVNYWGTRAKKLVPVLYTGVTVALARKLDRARLLLAEIGAVNEC